MSYPFSRPVDTSTGGAGGGGCGNTSGGGSRVSTQIPPRARPFPWPLPYSAAQGSVGGAGGIGMVSVPIVPYYNPYRAYFPYAIPPQFSQYFPTNPLRSR